MIENDLFSGFLDTKVRGKEKSGDRAELARINGGIDMSESTLNLQIRRDGNGVAFPVSEQAWDTINIQGFVPVIYRITPVNMSFLLGLNSIGNPPASTSVGQELPAAKEPELAGV